MQSFLNCCYANIKPSLCLNPNTGKNSIIKTPIKEQFSNNNLDSPIKVVKNEASNESIVSYGGFNFANSNYKKDKPNNSLKNATEMPKTKYTNNFPISNISNNNMNNMKFINNQNKTPNKVRKSSIPIPNAKERKNSVAKSHSNNKSNNIDSNSSQAMNLFSTYETDIFSKVPISDSDIESNVKLEIIELEGEQIEHGKLIVNCGGMVEGGRNKRDGVAIFGLCLNYTDDSSIKGSFDFIFKFKNNKNLNNSSFSSGGTNINNANSLFFIYFSKEKKKYYIRSIEHNSANDNNNFLSSSFESHVTSTYFTVKINKEYELMQINNFLMGDVFFIIKQDGNSVSITKLKSKHSPDEINKNYSCNKMNVTIGRSRECDLSFPNNKSFSKIHCTISFIENRWKIIDGNGEKISTNGIWVMPKNSIEIYKGLQFKVVGCSKCKILISN